MRPSGNETFLFPAEPFFLLCYLCHCYLHCVAKMTISAASCRMGSNYASFVEETTARSNFHSDASVDAVQALAHNITFTVAKSRYNVSRTALVSGERSSKTSEFGRGYAMEYFLNLRKHSRRRLRGAHGMKIH
jgi:hypothetical protein